MGTELVLWDECIPKGADYRMGMIKNNKIPQIEENITLDTLLIPKQVLT